MEHSTTTNDERQKEYPISNTHPTKGREAFATKNKIARAM
jgi:hypothetical protein